MMKILSRLMISVDELILIHNDFHNPVIDDSLFELDMERFREDAAYSKKIESKMQEEAYKNKDSASMIRYMKILDLKGFYKKSDYEQSHEYHIAKRNIQKYLFDLIYTEQYSLAKKAIARLYELTKDVTMLTWKVILFYLEGLYYYANGEIEKGLNEIEIADTDLLICRRVIIHAERFYYGFVE